MCWLSSVWLCFRKMAWHPSALGAGSNQTFAAVLVGSPVQQAADHTVLCRSTALNPCVFLFTSHWISLHLQWLLMMPLQLMVVLSCPAPRDSRPPGPSCDRFLHFLQGVWSLTQIWWIWWQSRAGHSVLSHPEPTMMGTHLHYKREQCLFM